MTGPTEQQQRLIYEWLWPELERKDWWREPERLAVWVNENGRQQIVLPLLDYNTLMTEAMPKLQAEGVVVVFDSSQVGHEWVFIPKEAVDEFDYIVSAAPWIAVVEYLREGEKVSV